MSVNIEERIVMPVRIKNMTKSDWKLFKKHIKEDCHIFCYRLKDKVSIGISENPMPIKLTYQDKEGVVHEY